MLNSYIGRMVAIYAVAAALAVAALSTYLEDWFDQQIVDATTDVFPCELCPYQSIYQKKGIDALVEQLDERARDTRLRFRLMQADDTVAGTLPQEPLPDDAATYLSEIALSSNLTLVVEQYHRVIADLRPSPEAEQMVLRENLKGVSGQLWLWGAILVLIGFAATGFIAFRVHQKLSSINYTADRIIASHDLSARIPASRTNSEFDRLTGNLNHMLDTIEARMEDMRQLSNTIAHDLRTPLTRLRGQLDKLQAKGADTSEASTQIDQILATFDALLRISHLEAGTAKVSKQAVDLKALVADVIDLYSPLADQNGHRILAHVSIDTTHADKDLLFQALANLTENAIKYAPENSAVQIFAHRQDGTLLLGVMDEGPGVPEHMLHMVANRFVQVNAARAEGGVGLGLALVQAIAEAHQGQLILVNDAAGFKAQLEIPEQR